MLRKLVIGLLTAAGFMSVALVGAQAQGIFPLESTADVETMSAAGRAVRSVHIGEMATAQKACDREAYEAAKEALRDRINAQISMIDRRLREINASTGDQRVQGQPLAIELLFERERLTKLRAMYAAERFVVCEPEATVVEYVRICDTYGQGFFYIPGTETCLNLTGDNIERRSARTGEVCDSLGLSGLTISSEDNCLKITGEVRYEFNWGDYRGDPPVQPATREDNEDDAGEDDIGCDALGLSGLTISSDTNCLQITGGASYEFQWGGRPAPDSSLLSDVRIAVDPAVTFTAPVTRSFLFHEVAAELAPAFEQELTYDGFDIVGRLDAKVGWGTLGTGSVAGLVNIYSSSATAYDEDIPLNSLNIPSVGVTPGIFVPGAANVEMFEFESIRRGTAFDLQFGIPLAHGQSAMIPDMPFAWDAEVLFGTRFGATDTMERTRIEADTTFAVENVFINYDTSFADRFFGGNIGLGVGKTSYLSGFPGAGGEPLQLNTNFKATLGYDMHRITVTDSVEAGYVGFAPSHDSTNDIEYSVGVPTAKLETTVGVGSDNWQVYLRGGISYGTVPYYDYNRPDSDSGGTPLDPTLTLVPNANLSVGGGFGVKF